MKFKRFLICMLAVITSVILVSCANTPEPASTDANDVDKAPAETTDNTNVEADPVEMDTVTVWTKSGHTKDFYMRIVNEYNNTIGLEKGIQIEYKVNGGDHKTVLDMALQNDQAPDLFKVVGPTTTYIDSGYIRPLDTIPGSEEFLARYDGFLEKGNDIFGDHVYNVPYNVHTIGLIYNKDMFKEAGIVDENGEAMPPKTMDELVDYAKRLTDAKKKQYGIVFPGKFGGCFNWLGIVPGSASAGIGTYDPAKGAFDFTKHEPFMEKIMQIKEDKSFFPGMEGLDYDPARAQFAEGRIGMFFGVSWDVGVLATQFPATCDWGVAPVPVVDENERYVQFSAIASWLQVNSKVPEDRLEKVFEVYKWFHTDEMLVELYEGGMFVPFDKAIVDMSTNAPEIAQWGVFADQLAVSRPYFTDPPVKLEGLNFKQKYLEVWAGATTLEEATADLNKRYAEALQKGIEDGSIDLEIYSDPDWWDNALVND